MVFHPNIWADVTLVAKLLLPWAVHMWLLCLQAQNMRSFLNITSHKNQWLPFLEHVATTTSTEEENSVHVTSHPAHANVVWGAPAQFRIQQMC
jgi:hypothetical protein